MIICIAFTIQLAQPIFEKYKESKTLTTVDTTNYPIWNIDFPGITVCSNIRISASRLRATLRNSKLPWKNLTEEEQQLGVNQIITNLVKFRSDPDLLNFTEQSRQVLQK